jgi:hypothetical protein
MHPKAQEDREMFILWLRGSCKPITIEIDLSVREGVVNHQERAKKKAHTASVG